MRPRFEYGDEVRVTRNVRNDGTFPGTNTGELLLRRGSVGFVRNMGTFLQDQVIYEVHFLDIDKVVGCREEELIDAAEPWVPSRFENRDRVSPRIPLAINNEVIAGTDTVGEIFKVLRDRPEGVAYHVQFGQRTLLVPESGLRFADDELEAANP